KSNIGRWKSLGNAYASICAAVGRTASRRFFAHTGCRENLFTFPLAGRAIGLDRPRKVPLALRSSSGRRGTPWLLEPICLAGLIGYFPQANSVQHPIAHRVTAV